MKTLSVIKQEPSYTVEKREGLRLVSIFKTKTKLKTKFRTLGIRNGGG